MTVSLRNLDMLMYLKTLEDIKNKVLPMNVTVAMQQNALRLNKSAMEYERKRKEIIEKYLSDDSQNTEGLNKLNELLVEEIKVNLISVPVNCFDNLDSNRYDGLTLDQTTCISIMFE